MKMTLLEMTQNILAALNEDEVNSIGDTQTAIDVSEIIREAYYQIITQQDWNFLKTTFNLNGLSDITKPTVLTVPENISSIDWIKVKSPTTGELVTVEFVEPERFLELTVNRTSNNQNNIQEVSYGGITYKVFKNKPPTYWTSIDGNVIYFDSYEGSSRSSILPSDTLALGRRIPAWNPIDEFVPELQDENFPYLLAEAKSLAFVQIAQSANAKAEQYARRGRYKAIASEGNLKKKIKLPDYGR